MDFNREQLEEIIKNIKMYKVYSTNIVALGYQPEFHILKVIFKGNSIYIYQNVEPELWKCLINSEHKGSTLNEHIIKHKEKYKYLKLL